MRKEVVILLAEDDEGHAQLIRKNLVRTGVANELLHFKDGQEIINFLFQRDGGQKRTPGTGYVLLLDIRMPKINGIQVLEQVKADPELCEIPVIMVTTTDDPQEVDRCHAIGCSNYFIKTVGYENFIKTIQQLGLFITDIEVPIIS